MTSFCFYSHSAVFCADDTILYKRGDCMRPFCMQNRFALRQTALLTNAKLFDQHAIALNILVLKIVEKVSAVTDHFQ